MQKFSIIDMETGDIIQQTTGSADEVRASCGPRQTFVEGHYDGLTSRAIFDAKGVRFVRKATIVDLDLVRLECKRRINNTGLPWMVERELSGGKVIPQDVKDQCAAIRAAFDRFEAMDQAGKPLPVNFTDDKHWS